MSGVKLWHDGNEWFDVDQIDPTDIPYIAHIAHPEALDAARDDVIAAAREIGTLPAPWAVLSAELLRALDNLDAIESKEA